MSVDLRATIHWFIVVLSPSFLTFSGCGFVDREIAGWTGKSSEVCVDHVIYLQFTSGVTVKYLPNGNIARC